MTTPRLMILGASTRAAAQSAVRAGFQPVCADHFADEDLFEVAEVLPLSDYPHGLLASAAHEPTNAAGAVTPWMYTGALENHPGLLRKLAAQRPLYGNPADVVARVRDPFAVVGVLTEAGLPALAVRPADRPPPRDGRWVIKPRRSAGGRGIFLWDESSSDPASPPRHEPVYFQQRAEGTPHSALYLATSGGTVLVGVARQLIGESRLSARPFAYCGSLGPLEVAEPLWQEMAECGRVIGGAFGLRGLFGVDFLLDEAGRAWLTEVNPRYTASVEVFETALGLSLLTDHVRAAAQFANENRSCQLADDLQARLETARRSSGGRMCGKAIVYAPFTLRAPSLADLSRTPAWSATRARLADRPSPGTLVPAGAPFCTVLIETGLIETGLIETGDTTAKPAAAPLAPLEPALSWLEAELEPCRETSVGSY
jgi:predicted ATP-grasp superfamily ATP-dependent carboligase